MDLRIARDPSQFGEFSERVHSFLIAQEAVHNLLFGILAGLMAGSDPPAAPGAPGPVLACVESATVKGGGVEAVAIMTPPRNLVISQASNVGAIDALARGLHASGLDLPGVSGPSAEAHLFAAVWRQVSSRPAHRVFAMQIYQATAITHPQPRAPGALRLAQPEDLPVVARWIADFNTEALNERPVDAAAAWRLAERLVDRPDGDPSLYLWEDGIAVSMAATGGPTPNGQRVFAVYTPPQHRRAGYASACVAQVSQRLLDQGRRYCFLFTDTANSTSNHIYRELGYRRVAPFDDYRFTSYRD